MFNLVLMYVLLFALAGLIGAGVGWSVRQFIVVRHIRILEADLGALRAFKRGSDRAGQG